MRDLLSTESARDVLIELFESVADAAQDLHRRAGSSVPVGALVTSLARAVRDDPSLAAGLAGVDRGLVRLIDESVERLGGPAADRLHQWVVLESLEFPGRFFTPKGDEYLVEGLQDDDQIYRSDQIPAPLLLSSRFVALGQSKERPSLERARARLMWESAETQDQQSQEYERPRCAA